MNERANLFCPPSGNQSPVFTTVTFWRVVHPAGKEVMRDNCLGPFIAAADDDIALIERSLDGDNCAFESLVRKHQLRIFRVAYSILGSVEDAEDILQKVLIKLSVHLGTFRRDAQFTSWLTRIVLNESLAARRAQRPTVPLDALPEMHFLLHSQGFLTRQEDPEQQASRNELRLHLEQTYGSLPKVLRQVFVLREIEGRDASETATLLNITIPAVKSRLFRARQLIHQRLKRRLLKPSRDMRAERVHFQT